MLIELCPLNQLHLKSKVLILQMSED